MAERTGMVVWRVAAVYLIGSFGGPAELGAYTSAVAFGVFSSHVGLWGSHLTAIRHAAEVAPRIPRMDRTLVLRAAGVAVVTAFVAGSTAAIDAPMALLSGLAVLANSVWLMVANTTLGLGRYRLRSTATLLQVVLTVSTLVGVGLASGFGATAGLLGWLFGLAASTALMLSQLTVQRHRTASADPDVDRAAALSAGFYQLGQSGLTRGDVLVLSIVASPTVLGLYSLGRQVLDGLMYLPNLLAPVVLEEEARGDGSTLRRSRRAILVLIVLTAGAIGVSFVAIPLVFGEVYSQARTPVAIALLAFIPLAQFVVLAHRRMGQRTQEARTGAASVLGGALVCLFTFGGVQFLGIVGAAAGMVLAVSAAYAILRGRTP